MSDSTKSKEWEESNQVYSNCETCDFTGWVKMTDGKTPELCKECYTK